MITRRQILLAFGACSSPLLTWAQARLPRIGFLSAESPQGYETRLEGIRAGLRDRGYIEGKNILIEYRWAEGRYERLTELARELVGLKVDVLITDGAKAATAAQSVTKTTPIVMGIIGDPVAIGMVASLARPGGNITGSATFGPEIMAKRLQLIHQAVPRTKRVAALFNPDNASTKPQLDGMQPTAKRLNIELQAFQARRAEELPGVFSALAKWRADSLVISNDTLFVVNAKRIAELSAKQRLPSAGFPEYAKPGGLIGYGVNVPQAYRQAGAFVDKILKGTKAGDIPIERATKFEFIVNRGVAKMLGLTLPNDILLGADEVIE